jgi:hypothetical protein
MCCHSIAGVLILLLVSTTVVVWHRLVIFNVLINVLILGTSSERFKPVLVSKKYNYCTV